MEKRPIIITGFMCAGKTTVARALGEILGCQATDLDDEITRLEGSSPAKLIAENGETAFREIETRVLKEVFRSKARVIALGGGAWAVPDNRSLIAHFQGISVWLDLPFDDCWKRIIASGHRPLAVDKQQAAALFDLRRSMYDLAAIRLAVGANMDAQELALRIVKVLPATAR